MGVMREMHGADLVYGFEFSFLTAGLDRSVVMDMCVWCTERFGGVGLWCETGSSICFQSWDHAMEFKLRWM